MKILMDECVDRRLAREIIGHSVSTVPQSGWAGKRNGELLALASAQFDVFVTVDQNLEQQHDLTKYNLAVVVMRAKSTRLQDLRPLVPGLLRALASAPRGSATTVA